MAGSSTEDYLCVILALGARSCVFAWTEISGRCFCAGRDAPQHFSSREFFTCKHMNKQTKKLKKNI